MATKKYRPELEVIEPEVEAGSMLHASEAAPSATEEELDEEEREFRALRRDLPGVKSASSAGIVAISVGKVPTPKNEFFRTHREFRPIMPIVDLEVGMEKQFFVVTPDMVEALNGIGITVTDHALISRSHHAVPSVLFRFVKPTATASRMNTRARKRSV
jgi:hypothetical protein